MLMDFVLHILANRTELQFSLLQGCNLVGDIPETHFFFPPQTKENDELTKICDDLILKMEKN